jgi:methyltransferase (TIGR00027 family)
MTAVARGRHRMEDQPPLILDDPVALPLVGAGWRDLAARAAQLPSELDAQIRASMAVRSRYAEDRLARRPFHQYVILGAGLDSFAWRRHGDSHALMVFEVDHPASQAWKRQRVEELGLSTGDRHAFAPVDFETQSLRGGLDASGFDGDRPTLFSWLGVTMYLTNDAVESTLRTVAACAPGTEVVMEYAVTDPLLDDVGREFRGYFAPVSRSVGEAVHSRWSPADVESFVDRCGLRIADHPSREDLVSRYFEGRDDGLRPWSVTRLLTAQVPPSEG